MPGIVFPVYLDSVYNILLVEHGRPRSLSAVEVGILRDYADLIVEYIQDQWPVDTGTSRDAWGYDLEVHPPRIGFILENEMDYAPYVARSGEPGPLFERLVPEAVRAYSVDLVDELTREIRRAEADRRRREEQRSPGSATLWGRRA